MPIDETRLLVAEEVLSRSADDCEMNNSSEKRVLQGRPSLAFSWV